MKKFILSVFLFLYVFSSFGRNSPAAWFQAQGKLSSSLLLYANTKQESRIAGSNKANLRFNQIVDYQIKEDLFSGLVIFNSPANGLLNKIKANLLQDDSILERQIEIFPFRTSSVNAYTLPNGKIFIGIGLIAYCKTEAELAFAIAHEIAHFKFQHAYERYRFEINNQDKRKKVVKAKIDEISSMKQSKENELEADSEGYNLFIKSKYNTQGIIDLLDRLSLADYPFHNKVIAATYFEASFYRLPKGIFPDSSASLISNENEEDVELTHPNIATRKAEITKKSFQIKGSDFFIDEKIFLDFRDAARFFLCETYLFDCKYLNAFYTAYLLESEFPDDKSIQLVKLKSLYAIQCYINSDNRKAISPSSSNIQGEIQKLSIFFKNTRKDDINGLILRKSLEVAKMFNANPEVDFFLDLIVSGFKMNVSQSIDYFLPIHSYNDSLFKQPKNNPSVLNSRLLTTSFVKPVQTFSIAQFCLSDYATEPNFIKLFESKKDTINNAVQVDAKKIVAKRKNKKENSDEDLCPISINEIIVFQVKSIRFKGLSKPELITVGEENRNDVFIRMIEETASFNGVKAKVLTPSKLDENDTLIWQFRDELGLWIRAQRNTDLKNFHCSNSVRLKAYRKYFGARYVCIVTTHSFVGDKMNFRKVGNLFLSFLAPIFLHYALADLFTPEHFSYLSIPVLDLETGNTVFAYNRAFDNLDKNDLIKSEFYQFFNLIYNGKN